MFRLMPILISGRLTYVDQFHIRMSDHGFLEGNPLHIRVKVLEDLPKTIARIFGGSPFFIREPPEGPLPVYTLFAQFSCSPMKSGFDYSSLILVWFASGLPEGLENYLGAQLDGIDWQKHAQDIIN
jgi:hypothetical protein